MFFPEGDAPHSWSLSPAAAGSPASWNQGLWESFLLLSMLWLGKDSVADPRAIERVRETALSNRPRELVSRRVEFTGDKMTA